MYNTELSLATLNIFPVFSTFLLSARMYTTSACTCRDTLWSTSDEQVLKAACFGGVEASFIMYMSKIG